MKNQQELLQLARRDRSPFAEDCFSALSASQFVPFFQPLIELRTGQLAGFEILARWEHPSRGLIPPSRFIAAAEQGGWIGAVTRQILKKGFAAVCELSDTLTLAINVSPLQLRDQSLPEQFSSMASELGFSLSRLVVEITESALIDDISTAAKVVAELKAMGCKLALDDFGTGYSSLNHLQSLPFDELKVDRQFVSTMIERRESRKIVSAVIGLGQSLSLATVAEGIETEEQAEMMLRLGCDFGQGYFFGHPMPAAHLAAYAFACRENPAMTGNGIARRLQQGGADILPSRKLAHLQAVYDGAPIGLAFVDQNLRLLNLNQRLNEMSGGRVEAYLGSPVSEVVPDLFPVLEGDLRRALSGEVLRNVEITLKNDRSLLTSYQPAFDEAGEIAGVAIAVQDITEGKRTKAELQNTEASYRDLLELNPQLLWIMDPRGQTLDVSPRWDKRTGRLTNRSREHEWLASIHPDDVQRAVRTIAQARREESLIDVEYRAADNAGGWRWKRSRGSPRFDKAGNVVCWYGSIQDIAGPTEPPSKARAPEAIAAMAPEAQGETCLKADTLTPEQRREQAIRRNHALLELEILDTPAEAEFDDLVLLASELCQTPISLVSLVTSERQWFKAAIGISASETPIEASFCAHAIRQPGLLVVEDALTDERFRDNPLVLGDPHIRFYAGMPVCAGNEVPVGTLCVIDTVPRSLSAEQAKALTILGQQVQTRLQLRSERIKLLRAVADNQMLSRQLEATNAALSEANERLQHLASTDMLTGLVNRRAFEEKLSDGFQKAQTNRRPLALLVVYLDDLEKRIDEFGHAAGNETLRSIGEVLRKSVRGGQIAARIGGEEFAVLLPEMTRLQAANLARRVQETLKRVRVDLSPVSVSVGCVWLDESYTSWQAFLDDAHREMLKAKRAAHEKMAVLEGRFVA